MNIPDDFDTEVQCEESAFLELMSAPPVKVTPGTEDEIPF